jgi:hypothetical protein
VLEGTRFRDRAHNVNKNHHQSPISSLTATICFTICLCIGPDLDGNQGTTKMCDRSVTRRIDYDIFHDLTRYVSRYVCSLVGRYDFLDMFPQDSRSCDRFLEFATICIIFGCTRVKIVAVSLQVLFYSFNKKNGPRFQKGPLPQARLDRQEDSQGRPTEAATPHIAFSALAPVVFISVSL